MIVAMANKKQERNTSVRRQDAEKRGRERKEVHRERNIGYKNAQEDSRKAKGSPNK